MLVGRCPGGERAPRRQSRRGRPRRRPSVGHVVLGEQTRFVFEMGDEALNVFNILQIVNTARTPVQPAE